MEATVKSIKNSTALQIVTVVVLVLGGIAAWHQIKLNRMQIAKLEGELKEHIKK